MSAGFTPGPWEAATIHASSCVSQIGIAHIVKTPRGRFTVGHSDLTRKTRSTKLPDGYTRIEAVEDFPPDPRPCADALLIASAPDIYAALVELEDHSMLNRAENEMVRAALAKARGQS